MRLPEPHAIEALHAIGFRSAVLHEEELAPLRLLDMLERLGARPAGTTALLQIGAAPGHRLYRIQTAAAVRRDPELLAAGASEAQVETQTVAPGANEVHVTFRNAGPQTFAHPEPIAPTTFVARWYDARGAVVAEAHLRQTLPLALAAGETTTRRFALAVPATPGAYRVAVAPASAPEMVVAVARVTVSPTMAQAP